MPPKGGIGNLGDPQLSAGSAVAQSLAIGPVLSVGFLSGTVAVYAGFNIPLSVAIAGVGALALGYALGLYARRIAGAGAVYEYLARGVHPGLGVVGAGIYLAGLLFLGAGGGFVGEGFFIDKLLAAQASISLGWAFWAIVSLVVVIGINWFGVKVGTRFVAALAVVSAIPLVVVAVGVLAAGGTGGLTLAVFDPSHTSLGSVFHGVLFAISLFIGFETVASLGKEARRPWQDIPRAMITTVFLCLVFYVAMTYAGAIGFGETALHRNAWYASGNPFGVLGNRYVGGNSFGWIISLAIIIDLGSVLIAFTLAASRLLMALARDQLLPGVIARTSTRFRSPVGGLVVIATWGLFLIVLFARTRFGGAAGLPDALEAALIASAAGSYLITLIYLLLALGALRVLYSRPGRRRPWKAIVVLLAVAAPVLALEGSLDPFPGYPDNVAVFAALGVTLLSIAWCLYLVVRRPQVLRGAGGHARTTVSSVTDAPTR